MFKFERNVLLRHFQLILIHFPSLHSFSLSIKIAVSLEVLLHLLCDKTRQNVSSSRREARRQKETDAEESESNWKTYNLIEMVITFLSATNLFIIISLFLSLFLT